jgi:uncharacterized protein
MEIDWTITTANGEISSADFDWDATGVVEILQNVKTILTTPIGTVVLDRAFGIDQSYVDKPITTVKQTLIPAVLTAIHAFEKRVEVGDLVFSGSDPITGHLKAAIFLIILTTSPY